MADANSNGTAEPAAVETAAESVPQAEPVAEAKVQIQSDTPSSQIGDSTVQPISENGTAPPESEPISTEQKEETNPVPQNGESAGQNGEPSSQNGEPSSQNGESHDRQDQRSRSHETQDDEKQETEQMRKLFIGGLTFNTTEEDLRSHFGKYGEIVDSVVMVDPQTKKSRCFGFVTYKRAAMVDEAQKNRPHLIHDRTVEPKRAIPREMSSKPGSQSTVMKAFVGGIKDGLEESDLKEYFSKFGNVTCVDIITEKGTTKKRGFAFVTFDDYDPVDKLTLVRNHTLKGFRLETQKAVSKEDMGKDSSSRDSYRDNYRGGSGGGGRDSYRDRSPPPRDYRDRPYGGGSGGRGGSDRGGYGGGGGGYDDRYGRGRSGGDDRHSSSGGYGSRDYRAGSGYNAGPPAGGYGSRGAPVGGWESSNRDYNPGGYGGGGYNAPPANSYNPPPVAASSYGGGGGGGYSQSYGQSQPIQYDNRYGGNAAPAYGGGGSTGYGGGGGGDYRGGGAAGGPMRGGGSYGGVSNRSAPYSTQGGGGYGGAAGRGGGGGGYGRR